MAKHEDDALERLLDLHGWTAEVGAGFWVSFKVRAGEPEPGRPHGITYSLTIHRPGGERILGYDNAHVAPVGRGLLGSRAGENWITIIATGEALSPRTNLNLRRNCLRTSGKT